MSSLDVIRNDTRWENTLLINFLNLFEGSFKSFNIGIPKNTSDIRKTFAIGGGEEVNSLFKSKIVLNSYEEINSILSRSTTVYNEKAFSNGYFKIKYLNNLNCNNIYLYVDEKYLYLIFLNKDLSQLFTVLVNRIQAVPEDSYKYVDIDDTHIGIQRTRYYPETYCFDNHINQFVFKKTWQEEDIIEIIQEGSVVDVHCSHNIRRELASYKLNEETFDKVLETYKHRIQVRQDLHDYLTGFQNRYWIFYNGFNTFICVFNLVNDVLPDDYRKAEKPDWYQCIFTRNQQINEPISKKTFTPMYVGTPSRVIKLIEGKYYFFNYYVNDTYAGYDCLENDGFFEGLQKFFKVYCIKDIYFISNSQFWKIFTELCPVSYISSSSGANRTLKYKIIIINKLLGYDRFNEEEFSLKQIHFNRIKKDYYFTNKLSLSEVLNFNFITEDEKLYIHNLLK